jgi:hypothetical protein
MDRKIEAQLQCTENSDYYLNVPTAAVSLTGTSSKLFRGDSLKCGIVLGYAEVVSFYGYQETSFLGFVATARYRLLTTASAADQQGDSVTGFVCLGSVPADRQMASG